MPPRRRPLVLAAALTVLAVAALVAGCGSDSKEPAAKPRRRSPSSATTDSTVVAASSTTPPAPPPPPPPSKPVMANNPAELADHITTTEQAIRDPATPEDRLIAAARQQQLAYRQLGARPEWEADVLARVPDELDEIVRLHADARRQFRKLLTKVPDTMPVWKIVAPAPADELLAHYHEAEKQFGVGWAYLATINLVESAMGRIRGLSVAGAQGPMQFMPQTWAAYGEGDINSPRDSILAAARYLAANSFTTDVDNALFRYNRHPAYVQGVKDYARVLELEPRAYRGFYHWQVYYVSVAGDLVLPEGYAEPEAIPVADYVARHPQ